jgi:hypothetical protein
MRIFSAGGRNARTPSLFWRNFWSRAIFDVAPCLEMRIIISQIWKFGAVQCFAAEFVFAGLS